MTAAITFDTHDFITKLEGRGFTVEQATGISDALKEVIGNTDLATKTDLEKTELRIRAEIAPLKWMSGVAVAGIISLMLKAFF